VTDTTVDRIVDAVAVAVGDSNCLVALGGGADSAVLLWAAVEAVGTHRVRGVFVLHGLEGSTMLSEAAAALALRLGVDCEIVESIVADGGNLEARARTARYQAIEDVIAADEIALTGHTSDDQAETVLMRLLSGSGSGAMAGIPRSRGVWRRPLLDASRSELREIAEDLDLPFADDPANEDRRFLRSWIRHDVLPHLEDNLGDKVKSAITRSGSLLGNDDAVLEAVAARIPVVPAVGGVAISTGALVSAPTPIAARVVRRAIRAVRDDSSGSAVDIEAVLSVARGGEAVSLTGALQATHEPPFVTIHTALAPDPPGGFPIAVGDTFMWSGSRYSITPTALARRYVPGGGFTSLARDCFDGNVAVRGLEAGDRIEIEVGSTPAKEVLRHAGVAARVRPHALVVTVDGRIAALVGVRVASWARPDDGETVVVIERQVATWT